MGFLVVGSNPTSTMNKRFQTFPIYVRLEKYSPRYSQDKKRLG